MRKNLKVSAVAGLIGVCIIGGVVALYPKTEPTVNQVTIQEAQTEEPEYDEYDSERLEDEQVVLDGGLEVVSNPEFARQTVEFKLRQYEAGALTDDELIELKEIYGSLVDEVQAEFDAENQEVSEPVKSNIVTKTYTSDGFISYSSNENLNADLQSYIDKVPSGVLNAITSVGYHIELRNDVGAEFGYSNVNWCGGTSIEQKRIVIEANSGKFRRSVVHECFHAYDDYLGSVSLSDEFVSIYSEEANSFVVHDYSSTHYLDGVQEYFAEACQEYVYHPSELQSNAPKTFEFVKKCIEEVR